MAERASGGQHKRLRCHSAPGLPHESKGCENLLAVILGNSSIGNSLIHCKEPATTSLLFPQALDLGYLCTGPLSSSPLAPGRQLSQNSTLLRTLDIDFGYFHPLMILDDMHSADSLRWCKLRMVSGHMSLFPHSMKEGHLAPQERMRGRAKGSETESLMPARPWESPLAKPINSPFFLKLLEMTFSCKQESL